VSEEVKKNHLDHLNDERNLEMIRLRDEERLSFRAIGEKFGISGSRASGAIARIRYRITIPNVLSTRTINALYFAYRPGNDEELLALIPILRCRDILNTKNMGKKCLEELKEWCRDEGHKMACGCPDHCKQEAERVARREKQTRTQCLAIKVVNLRRALETANRCLRENGQFAVGCNEDDTPTLRESQKFYAEVRKLDP